MSCKPGPDDRDKTGHPRDNPGRFARLCGRWRSGRRTTGCSRRCTPRYYPPLSHTVAVAVVDDGSAVGGIGGSSLDAGTWIRCLFSRNWTRGRGG